MGTRTIYEGDVVTYHWRVVDSAGNPVSLIAPEAYFEIYPRQTFQHGDLPVIQKSTIDDGGARIEKDQNNLWHIYVEITQADTQDNEEVTYGMHYYELRVTDTDGSSETVSTGTINIIPTGIRPAVGP